MNCTQNLKTSIPDDLLIFVKVTSLGVMVLQVTSTPSTLTSVPPTLVVALSSTKDVDLLPL